MAGGVPLGAVRPCPSMLPDDHALRRALAEVEGTMGHSDEREATALLAWLAGFRHHWPARFEMLLGAAGPRTIERLHGVLLDRNRYLKLRRIAVENLAGLL